MTDVDLTNVPDEVAEHLPGEWTVTRRVAGSRLVYLHGPDDQKLSMLANWNPGKWTIDGEFGDYAGHVQPEQRKLSINAAITKSPKRLAVDIQRRLLPNYRSVLAEVRERHQRRVAEAAADAARFNKLIDKLGGRTNPHSSELLGSWGDGISRGGNASFDGNRITITARLSWDDAEKLAEFLAAMCAPRT